MRNKYIAHVIEDKEQTIKEHSENTAALCREFSLPGWEEIYCIAGLYHDIGKYQESFQCRINGVNILVVHAFCGAKIIKDKYNDAIGWMVAYCIAGHHAGIPDGGYKGDTINEPTLHGYLEQDAEDYSSYKKELTDIKVDTRKLIDTMTADCKNKSGELDKDAFIDKYSFYITLLASALVDADSIDTAKFCNDDDTEELHADLHACLKDINKYLSSFKQKTTLQKARAKLQAQAFMNAKEDADIYLLNMPTGSGKTATCMKIALESAVKNDMRIIYVSPLNAIIDQTDEVFTEIFGNDAEILRHQSTYIFEDELDEESARAASKSAENWDAPIILTTQEQFFESLASNKRSRLRKVHNMANSILIFDEIHKIPTEYFGKCIQDIVFLTKYCNSKAIFLTATMPDFKDLIERYITPEIKTLELIQDKSLFPLFLTCNYEYTGEMSNDELLKKAGEYPSSLIVVNTKKTARKLYEECNGIKYHLSTYQTPYDRKRILAQIQKDLKELEEDYPGLKDVPKDRRITIISTSLIEMGVDMDVSAAFRELNDLVSILQTGGRCNREGKHDFGTVFVFKREENKGIPLKGTNIRVTKTLLEKYKDISDTECIAEYYKRVFLGSEIDKKMMHSYYHGYDVGSIPFRSYAKDYNLIDDNKKSIFVPCDEISKELLEKIKNGEPVKEGRLQNYLAQVSESEFRLLADNDMISYNSCIWVDGENYHADIGIMLVNTGE